jgi:hypothetical protein
MDKEQVRQWVEETPIDTSLNRDLEFWYQKAILQKIFGGIDQFTEEETIVWRQEWLQSNSLTWGCSGGDEASASRYTHGRLPRQAALLPRLLPQEKEDFRCVQRQWEWQCRLAASC